MNDTAGFPGPDAAGADGTPDWRAVPDRLDPYAGPAVLSASLVSAWSLALQARKIPCRVRAVGRGWQLLIAAGDFAVALDELRQYEAENRNWPPPLPPNVPQIDNLFITLSILGLLALFYLVTHRDLSRFGLAAIDWVGHGNAYAGAIRAGEWWRTLTALTLHADDQHLIGNLLIGGVFVILLCRTLGSGLAWSLLLACGACGNWLNAWLQAPAHRSIGASTAVFGVVGLLAAINLFLSSRSLRRRWYLPIAAALALLALLGSGGENTDIGAHLLGFAVGLVLGVPTGYLLIRRGRPSPRLNALLAMTCLLLIGGAWWAALNLP
jgi:membrane associated rhomboid family serine protease